MRTVTGMTLAALCVASHVHADATPTWTFEGDSANATMGHTVATAGDVNGDGYSDVIVSAPPRAAVKSTHVFHGGPTGPAAAPSWTSEVYSYSSGAGFGYFPTYTQTAAAAGDVNGDGFDDVIVGSRYVTTGVSGGGKVLVYLGSATGLDTIPAWTYEGAQQNERLGNAVATAGDVNGDGFADVIVGAETYDGGDLDEGRVLVFHGSADGPGATPAWTIEGEQLGALLGTSVSTAGDVNADGFDDVIVGAPRWNGALGDEGAAYVYLGSPSGLAPAPAWTATGGQLSARLGQSVSTAGDVNGDGYADVVVAAPAYDYEYTDEGVAFVFHGGAAGPGATPASMVQSHQTSAGIGHVSSAGDVNGDGFADVAVGMRLFDDTGTDEGLIGVVCGSASGVANLLSWSVVGPQANAQLGSSVATAGDVDGDGFSDVIAGAPLYDGGAANQGLAQVYAGGGEPTVAEPAWIAERSQAGALLGHSVASAGDVNGDGFSDVIVGARGFDDEEANEGAAFLHLGSASGAGLLPAWTAEGNQQTALFGSTVAGAGDVNGDGYDDVIVRASDYDNGEPEEGRAFVFHGSPSGLEPGAAWTAEGDQDTAYFSHSVATAGDVNGDGFADVIVGAPYYDAGETDEGRAFVYLGSASGLPAAPAWTSEGGQAGAHFGVSVASAGDVNGDGFSDVIVGADYFDAGEDDEGAAFVFLGSAEGLATLPAWSVEGGQPGAGLGHVVAPAMDVNGDGYGDVLVGVPGHDGIFPGEGAVHVYVGSPAGLEPVPAWSATGQQAGAELGISAASAGDVDLDGFSDVIVSTIWFDGGISNSGQARVYRGSATGLDDLPVWVGEGSQAGGRYGWSVAGAGDVNGDGFSDILIGAVWNTNGELREGQAFLHYGGGRDGLHRAAQQRRADDAAPIALLGRSDSPSSFAVGALGRSAQGRTSVRLEVEVKAAGIPFDGTGLVSGIDIDSGRFGAELDLSVPGLAPDSPYHWRARITSRSPFFPHSPWLSPQGNAVTQTDLRTAPGAVAVGSPLQSGTGLALAPPAPNPSRSATRLAFVLPEAGPVRLEVFDVAGRMIAVPLDGWRSAGAHVAIWDGRDLRGSSVAPGVYLARIEAGTRIATRRIVRVR